MPQSPTYQYGLIPDHQENFSRRGGGRGDAPWSRSRYLGQHLLGSEESHTWRSRTCIATRERSKECGAENSQACENDLQSEQQFKHHQSICFISNVGILTKHLYVYIQMNFLLQSMNCILTGYRKFMIIYADLSKPGTAGQRPTW